MKISLNWLNDYIDLKNIPLDDIVAKLTMSGLEVEEVINEKEKFNNFVVAEVKEKIKHPNADRLSVCTVTDGKEEYTVVCGAPNVQENQKVILAKTGAFIPKGNFKITKSKIRGIESNGMLCAEDELGLGENHDGILLLPESAKLGEDLADYLGLNDVIFEIAVTPNRADALSHIGVARDLAALYNLPLHLPSDDVSESFADASDLAGIEIIDSINCPRYSARILTGLTVSESPDWMKNRLMKIGLRPRNNIVDVTNYIMYETGQPLHAFDLDLLSGKKIIVKSSEEEQNFLTLDSKERKISKGTLLICDSEKPVAIAGVMGGENSEINSNTKNILIESAHFNSQSIRKTAKSLGLSTDASYRFERGVDPNKTVFAANRAAKLISELTGAKVAKNVIDVYPKKIISKEIKLRFKRVEKILGYSITEKDIKNILTKLGLSIVFESEKEIRLSVPTYRADLEREIDLIEEIARISGFDNIPTIQRIPISINKKSDDSEFDDKIRSLAVSLGFYEMINNPLQNKHNAQLYGNPINVINPQSKDLEYLRTSLIPGALKTVAYNFNAYEKNLRLFEIGNVFNKKNEKEIKSFDDFSEDKKLLFLVTGKNAPDNWNEKSKNVDFFYLKGMINSLLNKISLDNVLNDSYYHNVDIFFDYKLEKKYNNKVVGEGGKINKRILKLFDIDQDIYCFEFYLDELKNIPVSKRKYSEPQKYPKSLRDFAFIFNSDILYDDVVRVIYKSSSGLLKNVSLFDKFENEQLLGTGKVSLAFNLEFYLPDRTLTEEEIDKEFKTIIKSVEEKFNAQLRGK